MILVNKMISPTSDNLRNVSMVIGCYESVKASVPTPSS
jgi:hypothetical protein